MTTAREVRPEILDDLAPEDPRARRSRADLRRINALMGNARVVAGLLRPYRPQRILEIGAGDGAFMRKVIRHLPSPLRGGGGEGCVTLLDRQPPPGRAGFVRPVDRFAARARVHPAATEIHDTRFNASRGWDCRVVVADAFDHLADPEGGRFDAVVANLFLHHFEDGRLRELLALVAARTDLFVACEPRRSSFALAGTRTLGMIGCNDVTRHDARASVLAGFRDGEIGALWPVAGWRVEERSAPPFSHAFRAERTR